MVVRVSQEHQRLVLLLLSRAWLLLLLGPTLLIQRLKRENVEEWWLGEVSVSWRLEDIGGGLGQDRTGQHIQVPTAPFRSQGLGGLWDMKRRRGF